MPPIVRVKLKWNGFAGAPGYSNFFLRDKASGDPSMTTATHAANMIQNFGAYVRTYLPIEASLQVQSDVEVVEETTGEMLSVFNVPSYAALQGQAASAPYSAASGAVITWRTAGVRNGRRVRGRTFIVPLANSAYQSDGTLAAAMITSLNTNLQGAGFLGSTESAILGVYSRPSVKGASDGTWHQVTGFTIPDKVAVLRSRRD
jgi:hypothetical protein